MGIKDKLASLLGGKGESDKSGTAGVQKPEGRPSGSFEAAKEDNETPDPLDVRRAGTKSLLTSTAFGDRAARTRMGGVTKTRLSRSIVYQGYLEDDPFIMQLPEDIRRPLIRFMAEAIYMAASLTRLGTKEKFDDFFATLKGDTPQKAALDILLINMAGSLTGKHIYLKPNGDGTSEKTEGARWIVLRGHLSQPHPAAKVQKADLSRIDTIPLVNVLAGLPLGEKD